MTNEEEIMQKENKHDISIALIQKDIGYIKDSVLKMETTIGVFDKIFARKDELKEISDSINGIRKDIKTDLDKKVDKEEFAPIKATLTRINWLVISGVVIALLALIIKSGGN